MPARLPACASVKGSHRCGTPRMASKVSAACTALHSCLFSRVKRVRRAGSSCTHLKHKE